jgi:hypothetical protein
MRYMSQSALIPPELFPPPQNNRYWVCLLKIPSDSNPKNLAEEEFSGIRTGDLSAGS